MASFQWRAPNGAAGGAFDSAASWIDLSGSNNPALTPPGSNDLAYMTQGGGFLSGTGSVASLSFTAATWSIGGQITTGTLSVTGSIVSMPTNGGSLVVNGVLTAGANAQLSVASGGVLAVTAAATATPSTFGSAALNVTTSGLAQFGSLQFGVNGATTATIDSAAMALGGGFLLGATNGGSGVLTVQNGAAVVMSQAGDGNTPALQLGAVSGSYGAISVTGANSMLLSASNTASVGRSGGGALNVYSGASARFNTVNDGQNPALTIGQYSGATGVTVVSGAGSTLAASGAILVGAAGNGTLRVQAGASVTANAVAGIEAALAVGARAGGNGTLVVDGAGSQLVASGAAVIGGDNRGAGTFTGGSGAAVVTGGAFLQTGSMTIEAGSTVAVDSTSQERIGGDLSVFGTLSNFGTLTVSGILAGSGALRVGSGFADIGTVASANVAFVGPNATLRLHALAGNTTISGLQYGDVIDLVGNANVRLAGTTVTTTTGTIALSAPTAGAQYAVSSDGNGGTFIALNADTIGVYRFFDSNYGTHFFTSSSSEESTIAATRPDLVYEGIGLQAVDPSSNDPNAAPVFRFFDTTYGTHFFTASTAERDTVIATRPDLVYEGTGFLEHTTQQSGDTPVYRFFDSNYGTHFYTADANERATIQATRPDLVYEGIGFYAPT